MKLFKKILKVIIGLVIFIVIATFVVFKLPSFGGSAEGTRLEKVNASPEHIEGRFENNPKQNTDSSLVKNIQLYRQGIIREPGFEIPVEKINPTRLKTVPNPGLRANWFGHSSVLAEIDGARFMTDPVLSKRVSPFESIGPTRFHAPPMELQDLSGIDFVVISHDHYDHLDMKTTQQLAKQGTHFFVGLGIGAHLERWRVPTEQIHEMDWWQEVDFKGVKIACVPARHYSGRKWQDNSTLWTSWVVKGPKHSIYFSGDTGYADHFKKINEKYGAIDMTLIKVGAYGDTWEDIHMNPESAVQAHIDLSGKVMLPVHWATFDLSYHSWKEPIIRAVKAAKEKNIDMITPKIGENFEFGSSYTNSPWYDASPDQTK